MTTELRTGAEQELADWLRLTLAPGIGGESQRALLSAFGLPRNIFAATGAQLSTIIPSDKAQVLLEHDSSVQVAGTMEWTRQAGNFVLTLADADYPKRLLELTDPPTVIYGKGRRDLLNNDAVAIVGSRNATPGGKRLAEEFGRTLSQTGLCVASGLALGIDAAAHRGGLDGGSSTIAVIGTGADRVYPAANRTLAYEIAERGVIISEFGLGTPALAANFPRRNRLIAALSRGCLVVEAAVASGSLITARLAAELGRDVFAIPGSIHSPLAKGCHSLIKQGAKLVDSVNDILDEIGVPAAPDTPVRQPASRPAEQQMLLDAMGYDPCSVDELCERSSLTADRLYAMLLQLELDGAVILVSGGRFQRAN